MVTRYVAIGILAGLLTSGGARAQTPPTSGAVTSTSNQAQADALYRSAWQAANERNHDKACPMFDAVLALAPDYQKAAIAAAQCYEEAGKYSTAVNRYMRAQEVAAKQQVQDIKMLNLITKGIDSATNRISYVTINVPGAVGSIPGISVTLNGEVIDPANYGTKIPLDGGKHQIIATAPKRIPHKIEFEIKGASHSLERTLVPLEIDPESAKTPEPAQSKNEHPLPKAQSEVKTSDPALEKNEENESAPPTVVEPLPNDGKGQKAPIKDEPKKINNHSSVNGGIALIVLGGGLITGASFIAKEALELHDRQRDYSLYGGFSVAGFLIGTTTCLVGIAVASSPSKPTEQKSAIALQAPKILLGPNQVTFQARW